MTLVELNSTELYLIISTLNLQKQRLLKKQLLEKQPLPQLIEDIPYEFQYLIKKLENTFTKALEEEEEKEQEMSSFTNFSSI